MNGECLLTDKVTGEEGSIRNVSNGLEESQNKRKSERRSGDANEERKRINKQMASVWSRSAGHGDKKKKMRKKKKSK